MVRAASPSNTITTDPTGHSKADILFLFDHRHLVDFSIDEISRLVRALFADSPMRAKNLDHIARGHPETVAADSASGSEDEEGRGW